MTWFRYFMEAADDGAGGGGVDTPDAPVEERKSVFQRPEAWADPPTEEETPAPEASEGGEQEETPAEEAARLFAGKYKNADELEKAYLQLQQKFGRGEHLQEQPAEEELAPEEPPASWRAHNYDALGEIPTEGLSRKQQEQLVDLMQEDPRAAAMWALRNSHLLSDEEMAAVQGHWAANDRWRYDQFWREQTALAERARQEEELAPRMETVDMQRRMEGRDLAFAEVPLMQQHVEEFKTWLEERPQIDEHLGSLHDPAQIKEALKATFRQFYGEFAEQREIEAAAERERLAAEEAAAAEAGRQAQQRARTATRTAPTQPQGAGASDDDIRAAIRGARG